MTLGSVAVLRYPIFKGYLLPLSKRLKIVLQSRAGVATGGLLLDGIADENFLEFQIISLSPAD